MGDIGERLLRAGHNLGPPLEDDGQAGWRLYCWRVAKAWKRLTPEVARRRMAQADALGLAYRVFAAAHLDRGRAIDTLIFGLGGMLVRGRDSVVFFDVSGNAQARTAALGQLKAKAGFTAMIVGGWPAAAGSQRLAGQLHDCLGMLTRALPGRFADQCLELGPPPEARGPGLPTGAVAELLRAHGLVAGQLALVGDGGLDRLQAEAAGLPLFVASAQYFSIEVTAAQGTLALK